MARHEPRLAAQRVMSVLRLPLVLVISMLALFDCSRRPLSYEPCDVDDTRGCDIDSNTCVPVSFDSCRRDSMDAICTEIGCSSDLGCPLGPRGVGVCFEGTCFGRCDTDAHCAMGFECGTRFPGCPITFGPEQTVCVPID